MSQNFFKSCSLAAPPSANYPECCYTTSAVNNDCKVTIVNINQSKGRYLRLKVFAMETLKLFSRDILLALRIVLSPLVQLKLALSAREHFINLNRITINWCEWRWDETGYCSRGVARRLWVFLVSQSSLDALTSLKDIDKMISYLIKIEGSPIQHSHKKYQKSGNNLTLTTTTYFTVWRWQLDSWH